MSTASTRDRLIDAALTLFAAQGFEQTTVDQIVERAGVSRMTFFRAFPSKEAVVFPEHQLLIDQVRSILDASSMDEWPSALRRTTHLVMQHYVDEGGIARRRYGLTRSIQSLRDREVASSAVYQRLYSDWLHRVRIDDDGLWAATLAASLVAAHNHVLRRYLRDDIAEPQHVLDAALDAVFARFAVTTVGNSVSVITIGTSLTPDQVERRVREALA